MGFALCLCITKAKPAENTEALKAVVDSTTTVLSWFCNVEDLRSQHIAKKLGFVYVKAFDKGQYDLPNDFNYYIFDRNSNSF